MIPILYASNTTNFDSYGLGTLTDAISCYVTEERNSTYELEMVYPVSGKHYSDITISSIIKAPNFRDADAQAFRIYKITKPINGRVTINAEHISYQLSQIAVMPFDTSGASTTASGMFDLMKSNSAEDCPFTFETDITTTSTLVKNEIPNSFRGLIGGVDGSILDHFHGELEWDNYIVKLHSARGSNKNVTLRYGKNITDVKQESNIENTVTGICPYWKGTDADGNDIVATYDGKVVYCDKADNFPYKRTLIYDFSSYFDDKPSSDDLKQAAEDYITDNNIGEPEININVSFIDLADTEEYKGIISLETVKLCDTVTIIFDTLEINATAKIVKTKFDVIKDRYNSISIGDAVNTNLVKTINTAIQSATSDSLTTSAADKIIDEKITNATESITGNKGGYVIIHDSDGDSKPDEILITDKENYKSSTATLWRWNKSGLGYSSNGYDGDYKVALTMDGFISMPNSSYLVSTSDNFITTAGTWTTGVSTTITKDGFYICKALFENNSGVTSNDTYSLYRYQGRIIKNNDTSSPLSSCGISSDENNKLSVWYTGSSIETTWFGVLSKDDVIAAQHYGNATGAYSKISIYTFRIG